MDTIKRNKRIAEHLQKQLKRLKLEDDLGIFIQLFISPLLGLQDTKAITESLSDPSVLNNDTVLIETLKLIGLMEAAKDEADLKKLLDKREKQKGEKKELTDFDQILKAIMKVPAPKGKK